MASTVPVCQIISAGLAAANAGPKRFHHLGGGAPRLHVGRHLDGDARQLLGERLLQPRRISVLDAVRPRQKRGTGAEHQDVELLGGERARDLRQREIVLELLLCNAAFGRLLGPSRRRPAASNASESKTRPLMRRPPRSPA